ncbi:MAG TPA: hypothetical protein DEO94_00390 [Cyanobacteria bacterium UBA11991]|nr:RNA polymerase sigma factor [Cyanobacteriota bacterium]MDY6358231.1 RNA polymerase sigma factor [Cyanobacteriota bacterium]MDY6364988.1 RNA polymerase sigma factor [Cyanobacteriota bacterium]MDY6383255.1 RNA polymerase sigma factor [Cyanobacteriota bacterium]HCB10627.1 hypothetical protein [Cyanobacteria bacterium UBA11991]
MDFDKIIKTNKQNIKNIIRHVTKEDNEDIEQEVYLKIWKHAPKDGASKSWISVITKNASLDYLKSAYHKMFTNSQNEDFVLESVKDKHSTPENKVINLERQKRIINAIEKLKPKFKEIIMLTEIDGYSYEECAKKLNCPIGTVKSRIYNAKKELAQQLEDLL